jgi:hypothetical protein
MDHSKDIIKRHKDPKLYGNVGRKTAVEPRRVINGGGGCGTKNRREGLPFFSFSLFFVSSCFLSFTFFFSFFLVDFFFNF